MKNPYEDILHLTRPASPNRAKMSLLDRGAQFSAFAALPGFDAEIKKQTQEEKDYDEALQQAGARQDPPDDRSRWEPVYDGDLIAGGLCEEAE